MIEPRPYKPQRAELAKVFKDNRTLIAVDQLFDRVPGDLIDLDEQVQFLLARVQKTLIVTSDVIVPTGNYSILVDATAGPVVVTYPLAEDSEAFIVGVTKTDDSANKVTLQRQGANLLAGEISHDLLFEEEVLNFVSDATNWELAN